MAAARTIALEEHFLLPETSGAAVSAGAGQRLDEQLRDLGELRLREMDAAGIDVQRAVAGHGFVGAMIHNPLGTNGAFLDDGRFEPIFERAERLEVPIYLHPSEPPDDLRAVSYGGLPGDLGRLLGTSGWGWHAETGLAALRLVLAGAFERHPRLRLIIGHCGEMVPFMLARIDEVFGRLASDLAKPPSVYFLRNVWVTTAGLLTLPPVLCAIEVFGIDRVLFSVDYPYSANAAGRELLDNLPLSAADLAKLAGGNAERLLRLKRSL
jgi:predicted TIM-barrel fold metal-dependent hydrolase